MKPHEAISTTFNNIIVNTQNAFGNGANEVVTQSGQKSAIDSAENYFTKQGWDAEKLESKGTPYIGFLIVRHPKIKES